MGLLRLILAALALASPLPAMAACKMTRIVDFPVTMVGHVPMLAAKFGTKDARFILDSGAFHSTLSRASAAEFGLKVEAAPDWFRVGGIGGDTSTGIATSKDFSIAGIRIPKTDFVVAGSDTGTAGLIGQNILGLSEVEYDLPHGVVRLMQGNGCEHSNLAYWAGDRPVTLVKLEPAPDRIFKPHTVGTVLLNGVKVKAVFDSGAQSSLLSLAAAKRAGVTPDTPGVRPSGFSSGLGTRRVQSWLATFDKIDIGGEVISRPKIHIAQVEFGDGDMLIGADFFLTHRMFVSNANHLLFITYEGGPVFGLSPGGAVSSDGTAIDLTDKTPEPKTADEYSRRGAVFASNRQFTEALADFDKASTLAPTEGRYIYQRAMAHFARGERAMGATDLDRAIGLMPNDADAQLYRAQLRLRGGNRAGASEDLKAAEQALAPSSEERLTVAGLYDAIDVPEAALVNYDLWLKSHPEDSSRPSALNGRCWALGLLGRDPDKALPDCNAAVRAQPGNAAYLDSRALVYVRRGDLKKALADYDAAIRIAPRNAWSLYMRGIVAGKLGNAAQASADRAAALAINPRIGARAVKIGVEQVPPDQPKP